LRNYCSVNQKDGNLFAFSIFFLTFFLFTRFFLYYCLLNVKFWAVMNPFYFPKIKSFLRVGNVFYCLTALVICCSSDSAFSQTWSLVCEQAVFYDCHLQEDSGQIRSKWPDDFVCLPAKHAVEASHKGKWSFNIADTDDWIYFVADSNATLLVDYSVEQASLDFFSFVPELMGPFNSGTEACAVVKGEIKKPAHLIWYRCGDRTFCFSSLRSGGLYLIHRKHPSSLTLSYRSFGTQRVNFDTIMDDGGLVLTDSSSGRTVYRYKKMKPDNHKANQAYLDFPSSSEKHDTLDKSPMNSFKHNNIDAAELEKKSHFEIHLNTDDEQLRKRYEEALERFPRLERYRNVDSRRRIILGDGDGYVDLWSAEELRSLYGRALRPINVTANLSTTILRFFLTSSGSIKEQPSK